MKTHLLLISTFLAFSIPGYTNPVQEDAIYVTDAETAARAKKHLRKLHGKDFKILVGEPNPALYTAPIPERQDQPKGSTKLLTKANGDVWVHAIIDANGGVIATAITAGNSPTNEQAVLEAVRKWEFEPARYLGKPTMSMITVPFNFDQPDHQKAEPPR